MSKTIEDFKKENSELAKSVKELEAKLKTATETVDAHEAALLTVNTELDASKEAAAISELKIAEMVGAGLKAVAAEKPAKLKPVSINGKKYSFTVPQFYHESKILTAQEASLDNEILGKLVAVPGQGLLQEIK